VPNGGAFDNHWFAGGGRVLASLVLSRFVRQTLRPFLVSMNQADLAALAALIDAGSGTPVIDRAYPRSKRPRRSSTSVAATHAAGSRSRSPMARPRRPIPAIGPDAAAPRAVALTV